VGFSLLLISFINKDKNDFKIYGKQRGSELWPANLFVGVWLCCLFALSDSKGVFEPLNIDFPLHYYLSKKTEVQATLLG